MSSFPETQKQVHETRFLSSAVEPDFADLPVVAFPEVFESNNTSTTAANDLVVGEGSDLIARPFETTFEQFYSLIDHINPAASSELPSARQTLNNPEFFGYRIAAVPGRPSPLEETTRTNEGVDLVLQRIVQTQAGAPEPLDIGIVSQQGVELGVSEKC